MKLIDALSKKGRPFEIPDATRDDLPQLFLDLGFKVGAEIGVYKGEFTEKFCKAGLFMHAVDPWMAYKNYNEYPPEEIKRFQDRQDELFSIAQTKLAPYKDKVNFIRKTSMDAVEDFDDESLDFVYIDGHHGFRYVAEDLCEWSQKVKKGGIIAGHDYALNDKGARDPYVLQVKYVLHAFVDAFKVDNWYVIGEYHAQEGDKRDRWRSWFWRK